MLIVILVFGIVVTLSGLILSFSGIVSCIKKIKRDKQFIHAEGEVIGYNVRKAKIKYNFLITIASANEYSPVIRFTTETGKTIESADLPFTLKIAPIFKEYDQYYTTGERISIKYDPDDPQRIFYKPRTAQFIREAIYKILAGALISFIGYFIMKIYFD